MYYIFTDKNKNNLLLSDKEAHTQLRVRGAWQRQDLVFKGGIKLTDDEIKSHNMQLRQKATTIIIESDATYQNLKLRLDMAKLKNEPLEMLETEIKLLESEIKIALTKTDLLTAKEDAYNTAYHKLLNTLIVEWTNTLVGDEKAIPRDFRNSNTKLSGNEITE